MLSFNLVSETLPHALAPLFKSTPAVKPEVLKILVPPGAFIENWLGSEDEKSVVEESAKTIAPS